jgi:hypothetical protein
VNKGFEADTITSSQFWIESCGQPLLSTSSIALHRLVMQQAPRHFNVFGDISTDWQNDSTQGHTNEKVRRRSQQVARTGREFEVWDMPTSFDVLVCNTLALILGPLAFDPTRWTTRRVYAALRYSSISKRWLQPREITANVSSFRNRLTVFHFSMTP